MTPRLSSLGPSDSRRAFLRESGLGIGSLALAHLLGRDGLLAAAQSVAAGPGGTDLRPRSGHFPARARSIILLMQAGGPSQLDLFDPKPELQKRDGQTHPGDVEQFQPGSSARRLMGSPFRFRKYGESSMDFCEHLPHLASVADHICMIRSMHTDNNNHPQAKSCLNTGKIFPGRPSLGSWVSYALGSENQDLPAYVVLRDPDVTLASTFWDNGWLPALFRGTEIHSRGQAVLNLHPKAPVPAGVERNRLDAIARLNEERRRFYPEESELEARIRNYELAARMQLNAERLLDISAESPITRKLYGLDDKLTQGYGVRCLMARRLVEVGVRFVLVPVASGQGVGDWDHHNEIKKGVTKLAPMVDQPSAALIRDLAHRGLLETTIVLWTGEFGRLPITQHGTGRDHNRHAFTVLAAGGGFKAGYIHGATDEIGYKAAEKPVSCQSLLATLLHELGLDHSQLTFRHNGRDETLTDPAVTGAKVVNELLS
jgi:hypothetical protein